MKTKINPDSFVKNESNSRREIENNLFKLREVFIHKINAIMPKRKNKGFPVDAIYETDSTCIGWTRKINDKTNANFLFR